MRVSFNHKTAFAQKIMSYDLYFYKKGSNHISKEDVIDYLNNSESLKAEENETQWSYLNEETGVCFGIDLDEPNTDEEDIQLWDSFDDFENLNFYFSLNFIRPNCFGYEVFPVLEKIITDLDIYLLNPQDEIDPDNPQKFECEYLEKQWAQLNETLIIQTFSEFNVEYYDKEKSDFIWKFSFYRDELQENLDEDIFVPGYFLVKNKNDGQVYRLCVWPMHIPIVLPPVDYVIIQRENFKFYEKVEESGLVSINQINKKFGAYFEDFEYKGLKMRLIRQHNAEKIGADFDKLTFEYQIKDFGKSVPFDRIVNIKPSSKSGISKNQTP